MLLDPHIHTQGISHCSRCPADVLVDTCVRDKIDAIVLTNHYKHDYYGEDSKFPEWRAKYIEEYFITKEIGEKNGLKVFFGLEVTLDENKRIDYVIYGLPETVAAEAPPLCLFTQKELFEYCVAHNALLYQAHPYRRGTLPQDPQYLHGVEINCHPVYNYNDAKEVREFAKEHSLKLSCGSDYHGDTYKPHCGIYVPDDIKDTVELAEFLRRPEQCELEVHDIFPDWREKYQRGQILTK
ncbi:MAG: PHP domain-containing protein [Ruminococcaceae bacterium]|nr:PHP domain-containing protein [Oscillospiraceae bacterium]